MTSLDSDYITPTGGCEYGVVGWILHAMWKLYEDLVAQTLSKVFFVALLGIFGACTNLPQCNSVRRVAK